MKAFFAITIILFASCAGKQVVTELDDYQIYSLVLDHRAKNHQVPITIQRATLISPKENFPAEMVIHNDTLTTPGLKAALDDFERKNKSSITLQNKFARAAVTLITVESEQIEDNIIKLSQVGYNNEKSTALLFGVHSCAALCGSGDYYIFAKENGGWKMTKAVNCWKS